eukprot:CAMPEP_0175161328 /NCGR_PEP_ID=MMETSP0087-20121206/24542_1 /TAXON_ID=136419 /ORGANISM="Unknown Unknown, Strain D1" /LENGTH=358 /DNA_ID=CAMNT_0016449727 /DNA_START=120 /DNA_END=1196 /DNA_ORIENTATION=+
MPAFVRWLKKYPPGAEEDKDSPNYVPRPPPPALPPPALSNFDTALMTHRQFSPRQRMHPHPFYHPFFPADSIHGYSLAERRKPTPHLTLQQQKEKAERAAERKNKKLEGAAGQKESKDKAEGVVCADDENKEDESADREEQFDHQAKMRLKITKMHRAFVEAGVTDKLGRLQDTYDKPCPSSDALNSLARMDVSAFSGVGRRSNSGSQTARPATAEQKGFDVSPRIQLALTGVMSRGAGPIGGMGPRKYKPKGTRNMCLTDRSHPQHYLVSATSHLNFNRPHTVDTSQFDNPHPRSARLHPAAAAAADADAANSNKASNNKTNSNNNYTSPHTRAIHRRNKIQYKLDQHRTKYAYLLN